MHTLDEAAHHHTEKLMSVVRKLYRGLSPAQRREYREQANSRLQSVGLDDHGRQLHAFVDNELALIDQGA